MKIRKFNWFGAGATGVLSSMFSGMGPLGAATQTGLDINRQRAAGDEANRIAAERQQTTDNEEIDNQ